MSFISYLTYFSQGLPQQFNNLFNGIWLRIYKCTPLVHKGDTRGRPVIKASGCLVFK